MQHQKGQIPDKIVDSNYPLDDREAQNQTETGFPKAFAIKDNKLPTITLEVKKSGTIGSVSPNSGKPLREPITDTFDTEKNFHDEFVKPNEFVKSEGAVK